jgi:hypothetical protein
MPILPPPHGIDSEEFLLGVVHVKSAGWEYPFMLRATNRTYIKNLFIININNVSFAKLNYKK